MAKNKNKILYNKADIGVVEGKTVVLVGGTDGMGRIALEELAKNGAKIFLLGRTPEKTKRVINEVSVISKNEKIFHVICDLSLQKSVRKAADKIKGKCDHVDYLINCAGANIFEHLITKEGFELSWATNHLGPFLLTNLLIDKLKAAEKGRIINLSSAMQAMGKIDFEIIKKNKPTSNANRYGMAKLAMIMCTQEMAKELKGSNVTINSLNPGFINTNLMRRAKGYMRFFVLWSRLFASPARVGAERILTLMTSKSYEYTSGKFVHEDYIRDPNKQAQDQGLVQRVYKVTKEQVGLQ